MSEEPTEKLNHGNPFESRVLTELSALGERMSRLEGKLGERMSLLESRFGERMSALEDKVDARLHDTRPIWEAVLSRLELIDAKLGVLGLDMLEMRGEVDLLKKRQPPAA